MPTEPSNISHKLEQLRLTFFNGLPARLQKIEQTIQSLDADNHQTQLDSLIIALHSLAGTSATYGYMDISKHAKAAERYLQEHNSQAGDAESIRNKLHSYLSAIDLDIEENNYEQLARQISHELSAHLEINQLKSSDVLIYIIDDDDNILNEYSTLLVNAGYRIKSFNTLESLDSTLQQQLPNLLIIDIVFSDDSHAGTNYISQLKNRLGIELPVIFLSEHGELQYRHRAQQAGGAYYLQKPIVFPELIHTIELVVTRAFQEPHRVLIVDDDPEHATYTAHILQQTGVVTEIVLNPELTLETINRFQPEVILLDMVMPTYSGLELAAMIRMDPKQQFTSILFLSAETEIDKHLQALRLGADDFLVKPVNPNILLQTVEIRAQRARSYHNAFRELAHVVDELEHFKIALDQHAIVSIADALGNIIYVNQKFSDISGYSQAELLGQSHSLLNSGHHPQRFFADMWKRISSGQTWKGEIKNRTRHGEIYWVSSTITPVIGASGKPVQYISIRTDITHQKDIEAQFRDKEERLRRSQEYANIGTWDWNIQTGELFWSERIGPLFGYDQLVDTTYENFIKAVHPDDRDLVTNAVMACVEQGAIYDIEHRIVRTDGEIRWLSEKGNVRRSDDGTPIQMLGMVQDITQRKTTELALQESETRLKEAQSMGRMGHWSWDVGSGTIYWSDEIYRIFGYTPGAIEPTHEYFLKSIHPDDVSKVKESEQAAFSSGTKHSIDHRIVLPSGEIRWIHEEAVAFTDDDGRPNSLRGTVHDITERKSIESALVEAKEQAENASRSKTEFLSRMSHELRTPLNAILGFGQLMESDPSDPLSDSHMGSVEQILTAGWHLLELINEVLDLAKIESGQLSISMEPVDAREVIDECVKLTSPMAEQYKISVINELEQDALFINADRIRFKQIYINLLTNAIKYNRAGGTVTLLSNITENNRYQFSIIDTGIGIAEDKLPELFEPFNRLGAENTATEGTGIGLVIAKRLTEIMDGEIAIQSTVNVGTTFTLTFNGDSEISDTFTLDTTTSSQASQPDNNDDVFHVLYVEDNPANLKLVTNILQRLPDIKLTTATDGVVGLDQANRLLPDLILLDINLPGMSGTEICSCLIQNPATKHIPRIAISANAMPADVESAMLNGFDEYMTKPLDVAKFLTLVSHYRNKHTLTK